LGLLVDPTIVESLITSAGPLLAALVVASAAYFGYGRQKEADRKYDLKKINQEEYQQYLLAFQEASRWKGVDDDLHAKAENRYHNTQNYMLLHASEDVIRAVNAAHRYYVEADRVDWQTFKRLYAQMIIAMRADGYSPISLSVRELADNIPWTIGSELEYRRALRRAHALAELETEDKETED
jgi:hypothetical protein